MSRSVGGRTGYRRMERGSGPHPAQAGAQGGSPQGEQGAVALRNRLRDQISRRLLLVAGGRRIRMVSAGRTLSAVRRRMSHR
jgi:hypothetical protein